MTNPPATPAPTFSPGFRLSSLDIAILIIGCLGGVSLLWIERWLAIAVWYVVAHFFLFCNVLRMARSLELVWAVIFVCLAATAATLSWIPWPAVFGGSLLTTALIATIEARKPSYHGVGWQRLNPNLPEWWRTNRASSTHNR